MATQITQTQTDGAARASAREVVSYDPATGEEIGRVPLRSPEEVAQAVARAREAQKSWGAHTFRERAGVVMRARALVLEELDEVAALISRESGKPSAEAIAMEIVPTLDLMQFFARKTARMLRPERIDIGLYRFMGRTSTIEYRPLRARRSGAHSQIRAKRAHRSSAATCTNASPKISRRASSRR